MNRNPLQDPAKASEEPVSPAHDHTQESHDTPKTPETYVLKLYIAGFTPLAHRSVANAKRLCDEHLACRYQLEVIDLLQEPQAAQDNQIIAMPTLVRESPPPLRRVVGDLSDTQYVLLALDLPRRK